MNKWRQIPRFPDYWATADGRIRGPQGKEMKQMQNPSGHLYVLCNRGIGKQHKLFVHRAILLAFVGEPTEDQEARHLNGNPIDNRLENLAWGNRYQQRADDRRNGVTRGRPQKLSRDLASEIHGFRGCLSSREVAAIMGVSHTTILKIWRGMIWAQQR